MNENISLLAFSFYHDLGVSRMERLVLLMLVVWEQEDTVAEPLHWKQELHVWILDPELTEKQVARAFLPSTKPQLSDV